MRFYMQKIQERKFLRLSEDKMNSTYDRQIGGDHYKDYKIQPSVFINGNKLLFDVK